MVRLADCLNMTIAVDLDVKPQTKNTMYYNFYMFKYFEICYAQRDLIRSNMEGAQWLSGRVLDLRPRGRGFKPHQCHCVVVLAQDTFILT